ncbi:hypothetical protein FRC02_007542 [Tulasnella sp. 418]|nr:hypothetical protein FRC02_007542 [Tulasnella sp. 418]
MMEQISQDVQDDGIRNAEGNPITGGQLFRKYLLNRCQEDFERGWSMKESAAAAAIPKEGEVELYSDEYYAPLKTRRQGLRLVKFFVELFRVSMLTERVMHECIKKLLANVEDPDEEELESLCTLLMTAGQSLDTHKAKGHMDIYFSRIRELSKNEKLTPRIRFLLQDIIELRQRKWLPKDATAVPLNECVVEKEGKRGGTPRSQSLTASASNMFWMLSAVVEDNLVEDPPITARSRSSGGSHGRSMFDMSAATSNNPVTKKISLHRKFSMSTSTPNKKDELGQQMADKKSTPGTRKPVVVKARDKANINQDVEEFFDLRNANDGVKKHSMDSPKVYERHLVKGESARLMMTQIEELQLNVKKIPILASLIRTRAILILDQMNLAVVAPTDSDFYGYMRESQVTTPYENLEMLLVEYAKKIMDAEKLIEKVIISNHVFLKKLLTSVP